MPLLSDSHFQPAHVFNFLFKRRMNIQIQRDLYAAVTENLTERFYIKAERDAVAGKIMAQ